MPKYFNFLVEACKVKWVSLHKLNPGKSSNEYSGNKAVEYHHLYGRIAVKVAFAIAMQVFGSLWSVIRHNDLELIA